VIVFVQLIYRYIFSLECLINHFRPKCPEWYSPYIDLEHTIQVCRGERVKCINIECFKLWFDYSVYCFSRNDIYKAGGTADILTEIVGFYFAWFLCKTTA